MKRLISIILAVTFTLLAGCSASPVPTETSATASAPEQFLIDRLGSVPENVVLGDSDAAAEYGIDMSDFEDDGYVLRTVGDTTLIFGKTEDGLDRAVRAYVKAVGADTADSLDVVYHEGYRIERLTIAGRDISEYTLYYPDTANENMIFAASEFVRLIEKATGVTVPVVVGAPVAPAIELRHTDDPALETDGYRYSVTEDGLVIEGAVKRGCMNGVWRFLQNECGWDFLIYGDSYLNEAEHVDIPVGTEGCEEPAFEFFDMWNRYDNYTNERILPTAAQNSYGTVEDAHHGIYNFYNYYDMGQQPCYSDEEFWDETLYNVRNYVAANYDNPSFYQVNIGQNDSTYYCMCETCAEIFLEEGGNAGAVIRHANFLADEINKEFPGIYFTLFAYAGSNIPPKKTAPNEWVYVTFATDWSCTNHCIDGSGCKDTVYFYDRTNSTYAEWLEGWCALNPNVYIRGYNLGTGLDEYTVIDTIYDDYTYFHSIGVSGICLEGSDYGNWGLKRIEQVLISELNWNMDMTREEFEEIYHTLLRYEYGDGWEHVLDYTTEWSLSQDLANCWSWWGISPTLQTSRFYDSGYFAARFDSFVESLDAALPMANSAKQEEMVKRLSVSMLYKGCYASYFMAWLNDNTERLEILSQRYSRMIDTLTELGEDHTYLLVSYAGNPRYYGATIEEEAWDYDKKSDATSKLTWLMYFYVLTGRQPPEEIPDFN